MPDRLSHLSAPTHSEHPHAVHFYSANSAMEMHVGRFIHHGIQAGDTVITIATKERREGFARYLRAACPDLEGRIDLLSSYHALDADEMLAAFLVNSHPDRSRFFASMDRMFSPFVRDGQPIRVFGEMVTRLWQAGQPDAALELEGLWNELSHRYTFSLLCAYPLGLFAGQDPRRFLDTCAAHSQLSVPAPRAAA